MKLYAYNKPVGEETAEKLFTPEGGAEVKLYPVAPLSKDGARGLVVYTDDASKAAELSEKLAGSEMEYHVWVKDHLSVPIIQAVRAGVELPDGSKSQPCRISWTEADGYVINYKPCTEQFLEELSKAMGTECKELKRFRVANLKVKKVPLGGFEEYSEAEVEAFLAM